MKISVKKIIAVLCSALLIGAAMAPSVFALDFFNNLGDILGDDLGGIFDDLFGNGNPDTAPENPAFNLSDLFSNPGGILDALRERLASFDVNVSNSAIASALVSLLTSENAFDLSSLLDSNDLLSGLLSYFTNGLSPAEDTTEEEPQSSEESTTEEPSSAPSTTLPPIASNPTTQPFPDTTADENSSEPEYSYVEPSVEFTDVLTTVPFSPIYDEDFSDSEEGSSAKMIAGIVILILSAGAVIVVVAVLKKTKV